MERSVKDLHIVIIGAGIGGLATALSLAKRGFTHIDVYETASSLGFVGAGIQLAPNMARILDGLGCWGDVEKEAVDLRETSVREGDTDVELGHVDLTYVRATYGYPHMVGHRSSLAGALYAGCQRESSITFHFSTTVSSVSSFTPKPTFTAVPRTGYPYTITADILVAADGVKSVVRDQLLQEVGDDAKIIDTGQAAYRIMLPLSAMSSSPALHSLITSDCVTRWIGEKRHIIAYPVSSKTIYNISTVQPDTHFAAAPSATYTTKGGKTALLATFADFCPTIQELLQLVPEGEVCEWKLRVYAPLSTWVHGSTALAGDACHATLPHLAQGAAQAIEDAAVLAVVLERAPNGSAESVGKCLRVYEKVRKERADTLVGMAAASGRGLHLGEGEAREERDRMFRAMREGSGGGGEVVGRKMPDKWADREVQKMIYGHDCVKVAEEGFAELYAVL